MIGAMPAIAVRGKKSEGSIGFISRPHKLSLHFRPPLTHQVTPTASPVHSPPLFTRETAHHRLAKNFLSKRIILQVSVLVPLVGIILLFIGLIQLSPNAEANIYSIPLIVAGSVALLVGLFLVLLRMYFTWQLNRLNRRRALPQIKVNEPSITEDVEKAINVPDISVVQEEKPQSKVSSTCDMTITTPTAGDNDKETETSKLLAAEKTASPTITASQEKLNNCAQ